MIKERILNIFQGNLIEGLLIIFVPLFLLIFFLFFLKKLYLNSQKFLILIKQIELVRRSISPLKKDAKQKFAMDLMDRNISEFHLSSHDISVAIKAHGVLIDAGFERGIQEIFQLLVKFPIPELKSPEFEKYTQDNFVSITSKVWEYVGSNWDTKIYYLLFSERYSDFEANIDQFEKIFVKVFTDLKKLNLKTRD